MLMEEQGQFNNETINSKNKKQYYQGHTDTELKITIIGWFRLYSIDICLKVFGNEKLNSIEYDSIQESLTKKRYEVINPTKRNIKLLLVAPENSLNNNAPSKIHNVEYRAVMGYTRSHQPFEPSKISNSNFLKQLHAEYKVNNRNLLEQFKVENELNNKSIMGRLNSYSKDKESRITERMKKVETNIKNKKKEYVSDKLKYEINSELIKKCIELLSKINDVYQKLNKSNIEIKRLLFESEFKKLSEFNDTFSEISGDVLLFEYKKLSLHLNDLTLEKLIELINASNDENQKNILKLIGRKLLKIKLEKLINELEKYLTEIKRKFKLQKTQSKSSNLTKPDSMGSYNPQTKTTSNKNNWNQNQLSILKEPLLTSSIRSTYLKNNETLNKKIVNEKIEKLSSNKKNAQSVIISILIVVYLIIIFDNFDITLKDRERVIEVKGKYTSIINKLFDNSVVIDISSDVIYLIDYIYHYLNMIIIYLLSMSSSQQGGKPPKKEKPTNPQKHRFGQLKDILRSKYQFKNRNGDIQHIQDIIKDDYFIFLYAVLNDIMKKNILLFTRNNGNYELNISSDYSNDDDKLNKLILHYESLIQVLIRKYIAKKKTRFLRNSNTSNKQILKSITKKISQIDKNTSLSELNDFFGDLNSENSNYKLSNNESTIVQSHMNAYYKPSERKEANLPERKEANLPERKHKNKQASSPAGEQASSLVKTQVKLTSSVNNNTSNQRRIIEVIMTLIRGFQERYSEINKDFKDINRTFPAFNTNPEYTSFFQRITNNLQDTSENIESKLIECKKNKEFQIDKINDKQDRIQKNETIIAELKEKIKINKSLDEKKKQEMREKIKELEENNKSFRTLIKSFGEELKKLQKEVDNLSKKQKEIEKDILNFKINVDIFKQKQQGQPAQGQLAQGQPARGESKPESEENRIIKLLNKENDKGKTIRQKLITIFTDLSQYSNYFSEHTKIFISLFSGSGLISYLELNKNILILIKELTIIIEIFDGKKTAELTIKNPDSFKGVIRKARETVSGLTKQKNAKKAEDGIKAKDAIKAKLQQCLEDLKKLSTKKSEVSSVNSSKVGHVDDFRSTPKYKEFVKQYYQNNPEMQGPSNAETGEKRKKAMNNAYKQQYGNK